VKKGRKVSAQEFAAQLARDPEYRAGIEAQNRRAAEVRAAERWVLEDLEATGYPATSLEDLKQRYAPFPSRVSAVLLGWLARSSFPQLDEAIVRALGSAGEGFDVIPLLRLFETTTSDSLRWAIANTLAELRPLDVREWLIKAMSDRQYGRAREMLPLAIVRTSPAPVANEVLLAFLEEMPGHVALALAYSGGPAELEALRAKVGSTRGWAKKEIEKAIRAISRRT
jgi:hypothetical protein